MLLGDIIKQYRKEHKMSLQNFADKIGTSRSYIYMLEKNVNPSTNKPISPSIETLKSLAKAMNMDLDFLLKQLDSEQDIILDEKEYKKQFKSSNNSKSAIVFIYGTIPAGVPMECIEDIIDTEEISAEMLKGNKEYFGLKIKGNSMQPDYLNGDIIICEKVNNCENGQDCVVMVNGNDGTFKRVFKNKNGVILQPLNPEYQPMIYTNEQIEKLPVRVIGRVVELRRKK